MQQQFYTAKGYERKNKPALSEAMEDYLEMLVRSGQDPVRAVELASRLHVRSSSVTKMAQRLGQKGLVTYEKYGALRLTGQGREIGEFLVWRHNVLMRFFSALCGDDVLEEVEQIEHHLRPETVRRLAELTDRIQGNS